MLRTRRARFVPCPSQSRKSESRGKISACSRMEFGTDFVLALPALQASRGETDDSGSSCERRSRCGLARPCGRCGHAARQVRGERRCQTRHPAPGRTDDRLSYAVQPAAEVHRDNEIRSGDGRPARAERALRNRSVGKAAGQGPEHRLARHGSTSRGRLSGRRLGRDAGCHSQ